MKLIITEKPSVAQNIAKILKADKRRDGYFEGNDCLISWAFGHLFTLNDVKDYNPVYKKWNLEHYPFIPENFTYKLLDNPGVKKQFSILKQLANRQEVDELINATDADREGELIFREIDEHLGLKSKREVKRLWLSSHTPEDVLKGMKQLKSDKEMQNLKNVAYLRQWLDWLVGINLTSVATLKYGGFKNTIYVGRVIMPTLKLVYDRDLSILNFKVEKYFELEATFSNEKNAGEYVGIYMTEEQIKDRKKVEAIEQEIKEQGYGKIEKRTVKKVNEKAPRLFSLTDLQGHITSKFKEFTADSVLKTAQSLYENKFITYPRTASRHLNKSQISEAKRVFENLSKIFSARNPDLDFKFTESKDIFDDAKVDSHSAIIPTYIIPKLSELKAPERIVYNEVVKRFLAQFLPKAVYQSMEIITKVGEHSFKTSGRVLLEAGWTKIYGQDENDKSPTEGEVGNKSERSDNNLECKDQDKESKKGKGKKDKSKQIDNKIPTWVKEKQTVKVAGTKLNPKETTPPKHYTEASLLSAMENCGKRIDKEDLEHVLKGYSIGTSATRAETLQKLKRVEYIKMSNKNILITERGIKIIELFPVKELLDPDFTGRMEKTLKDIENGTYNKETFYAGIKEFVCKSVNIIKGGRGMTPHAGPQNKNESASNLETSKKPCYKILGKCLVPGCEGNIIEGSKGYGCSKWKEGCKFVIWKNNYLVRDFKLELTDGVIEKLLAEKSVPIKLMGPKSHRPFKTNLICQEREGRWLLGFKNDKENNQ